MKSVKKKHISTSATYLRHSQVYGESGSRGCIGSGRGESGGDGCTFIGGGGCISISMCISGADGGGEGGTSSYFAGDEPLRAAILASCAATRVFTSSSSITTQLSASVVLRYFLPPPGFLV